MSSTLSKLNQYSALDVKYNLGPGIPPMSLLPKFDVNECLHAFEQESGKAYQNYHPTKGLISEILSEMLNQEEQVSINPQKIVITNGVQEAILISLLLKKNLKLAVFEPTYPGVVSAANSLNISIVQLNLNDIENELSKLSKDFLLYVCADFSNPTGQCIKIKERELISQYSNKLGFYIFEDATYRPFFLNKDNKINSLHSMNPEKVIYSFSFSKIFSPSIRIALNILPKNITQDFEIKKASISINSSGYSQAILGGWLLQNMFMYSPAITRLLSRLKKNHLIIDKSDLKSDQVLGGFFRLIEMKMSIDSPKPLVEGHNILVLPLSYFSKGKGYEKVIRVSLANITSSSLIKVSKILSGKNQNV